MWPLVFQVFQNGALTTLELPELVEVGGSLVVRARPLPRSADRARVAARIAPSLPCCRAGAWPHVRQVNKNAKLASLNAPKLIDVSGNRKDPKARALARARLIAPAQPRASRRAFRAAELARGHACVRLQITQS